VPDYLAALTGDLRGLRIGVPREYFLQGIQPEVESAVRDAIALLAGLGAEIVDVSLPHTGYALPAYYLIAPPKPRPTWPATTASATACPSPATTLRQAQGRACGTATARRAGRALAPRSSGGSCSAPTPCRPVITTPTTSKPARSAPSSAAISSRPGSSATCWPRRQTRPPPSRSAEKAGDPLQMYLADVFTLALSLAGLCGISLPVRL